MEMAVPGFSTWCRRQLKMTSADFAALQKPRVMDLHALTYHEEEDGGGVVVLPALAHLEEKTAEGSQI